MPEEDQSEKNFLGKPECSRKVVEPERENLKRSLKENAERENEKEREEFIQRGEPQREKIQKLIVIEPSSLEVVPRVPFPHRLKKTRKKDHFEGILEVFKNVQINVPLLDA